VSIGVARLLDRAGFSSLAGTARTFRWELEDWRYVLRPRHARKLTRLWIGEPVGRRAYRSLGESELLGTRRSDTVFVFGSGKSILDVDKSAWAEIAEHDVVAFSHFHRQRFVRVDYHLVAEAVDLAETSQSIAANPGYADTIFVLLKGWKAERANEMVARRLLPLGARIFRVRRLLRGRIAPPSRSFKEGLVHGANSSLDAVNFAYLMGWRTIVVAGVDLYNKEYFWLPAGVTGPGEPPGTTARSRFPGADQIVQSFSLWRERMAEEGVDLVVYDGRSLLAQVLPVFARRG
jgi:hypothetical protein